MYHKDKTFDTGTIIEGYFHVLKRDRTYVRIEMSNGTVFIGEIYEYDKSGISLSRHPPHGLVVLNLNYVLSIEASICVPGKDKIS